MDKHIIKQLFVASLVLILGICQYEGIDSNTRILMTNWVAWVLMPIGIIYLLYKVLHQLLARLPVASKGTFMKGMFVQAFNGRIFWQFQASRTRNSK